MEERVHSFHLKPGLDASRTAVIADRWRWWAFLAPTLWALWNRHWLAAVPLGALSAGVAAIGMTGWTTLAAVADLAIRLGMGWEAASLARLDRSLRGWRDLGGESAVDEEAAEIAWFSRRPWEVSA